MYDTYMHICKYVFPLESSLLGFLKINTLNINKKVNIRKQTLLNQFLYLDCFSYSSMDPWMSIDSIVMSLNSLKWEFCVYMLYKYDL